MEYASKSLNSSLWKLTAMVLAVLIFSGPARAGDLTDNENRTAEKARVAVNNAGPDDWYTLANAAEKCIKKKVNLEKPRLGWSSQSRLEKLHIIWR